MKLGLISPRVGLTTHIGPLAEFWRTSRGGRAYADMWQGTATGLLVVAALTPSDVEVEFVDENVRDISYDAHYDLVGITVMTQQAVRAYEIARRFRRDGKTVVLGGIHPTVLPHEAKEHADAVVIGEAEDVWGRLVEDFKRGSLEPFYKAAGPCDMSRSPAPRYDLLDGDAYQRVVVQTSRGCPHDCDYCVSSKVFGRGGRAKSTDAVLNELRTVRDLFPGKTVFFGDDNLFARTRAVRDLLPGIAALGIRWTGQADVSLARDDELLAEMAAAGCIGMFVGFESLSENALREVDSSGWKPKQVARYEEAVRRIQRHCIPVVGAFMVGFDDDGPSTFGGLIDFVDRSGLTAPSFTVLTPLPGSRVRERLAREERLLPHGWDRHTAYDVNFVPRRLSVEELEKGLTRLYLSAFDEAAMARRRAAFIKCQVDWRRGLSGTSAS